MTDTNVVIIGAGLAGLGAAAACRDSGRAAVVLEASGRVGGRAWTDYPAAFGGIWFDMGAIWFHNAEHNPLVPLARAAGDTLLRSDEIRQERTVHRRSDGDRGGIDRLRRRLAPLRGGGRRDTGNQGRCLPGRGHAPTAG